MVSLNPYRDLGDGALDSADLRAPHVFRVAHECLQACADRPQTVLCSGESGAGKTESTRRFLRFIGERSGSSDLQQRIFEANPVLEALGNAKTVRNNNSSRFGKFVRCALSHSAASGEPQLLGASIDTYLLERSRVTGVRDATKETNFHIFGQIAAASKKRFKLLGKDGFVHGSWAETSQGLKAFGIDPALVKRTVEGILHLGEIEFQKDGDGAKPTGPGLTQAAALLGLEPSALSNSLMFAELQVRSGGTQLMKRLTLSRAQEQRDALCRLIYAQLFSWVVDRVNDSLACAPGQTTISVLDIFGFEIFDVNGFEQLLINFANERLHSLYIQHALKVEQERYKSEGVAFTPVEYSTLDNAEIVSSLNGLLRTLDDATQLGSANFKPEAKKDCITLEKRGGNKFSVNHFAGSVSYDPSDMTSANTDAVDVGLHALCLSSDSLGALFGAKIDGRKESIGKKFTLSLTGLLASIASSDLHFIKCIKPNSLQNTLFESDIVLTQVLQTGLLEVCKLRAAGYHTHMSHAAFQAKYGVLQISKTAMEPGMALGKTLWFLKKEARESLDVRLEVYATRARQIQQAWRAYSARKRVYRQIAICLAIVKKTEAARVAHRLKLEAEKKAWLEREEQERQQRLKQEKEAKAKAKAEAEAKAAKVSKMPAPVVSQTTSVAPIVSSSPPPISASALPSSLEPPASASPKTTRRFSFRSNSSAPNTPTSSRKRTGSFAASSPHFTAGSLQELDLASQKLAMEMGLVDVAPEHMPLLERVLSRAQNKESGDTMDPQKYHFPKPLSIDNVPAVPKGVKKGKETFRGKNASVFVSGNVATKVVKSGDLSAMREMVALESLANQPGIANLTASYISKKDLWLQMTSIEGISINTLLRYMTFESLQTSYVMRQVFSGLAILQAANLVHRSLSTHNVMVDGMGQAYIIDFGQASFVPAQGLKGMTGAPFFVSPEMVRGELHSFKTDIYSAGAIAYTCVTGHLPTLMAGQKTSKALGLKAMFLVGTGRIPQLEGTKFNSTLIDFVTVCMAHDHAERPDAARSLMHPFLQQQVVSLDLKKPLAKALKDRAVQDFFKER